MKGRILEAYVAAGSTKGELGYPIASEALTEEGELVQKFEAGLIVINKSGVAQVTPYSTSAPQTPESDEPDSPVAVPEDVIPPETPQPAPGPEIVIPGDPPEGSPTETPTDPSEDSPAREE